MPELPPELCDLFKPIEMLVLDVDGVLTDGGAYYDADGTAMLRFSIVDGLGLVLLRRAGIKIAIITTSNNPIIAKRAERLGIHYLRMGAYSKSEALPPVMAEAGVDPEKVAYVSDDVNDVGALKQIGVPIAVSNAQRQVKAIARYTTHASGGSGAVREVCNLIIDAKGFDPVVLWEAGDA